MCYCAHAAFLQQQSPLAFRPMGFVYPENIVSANSPILTAEDEAQ